MVSGVLVTEWLLTGPNQNRLCNIQYMTMFALLHYLFVGSWFIFQHKVNIRGQFFLKTT